MATLARSSSPVAESDDLGTADARVAILVTGYFDRGNLGDNAMRQVLLSRLERFPSIAADAVPLPAVGSVRDLPQLIRFLAQIRASDAVILCGGTHFHDAYRLRSLRLLAQLTMLFSYASWSGTSVIVAGVGVGPLQRGWARRLVRRAFHSVDFGFVRDRASADCLRSIGAAATGIATGADMAVLLCPPEPERTSDALTIAVSVTGSLLRRPHSQDALVGGLLAMTTSHPDLRVKLFVFHEGRMPNDVAPSEAIAKRLTPTVPTTVVRSQEPAVVLRELGSCDIALAARYHAIVLARLVRIPTVVLPYEDKCRALALELGIPPEQVLEPDQLTPGNVGRALLAQESKTMARTGISASYRARAALAIDSLLSQLAEAGR